MLSDFFIISYWWLLLFGLGVIFFPTAYWLFKKFLDFGYPFSKIIGIAALSYSIWLLGSIGIPFTLPTLLLTVLALALFNYFLYRKNSTKLQQTIKQHCKFLIFEEIIFFFCLLAWSFIRGCQPNIQGLEKFMDFGFINSILKSSTFPPADMWQAGQTINYYYFGHLVAAVLTKLSNLDSAVTYNLMIATIFGLAFTETFSIGANLSKQSFSSNKKNLTGFLSASLLTLGGNLQPAYFFLTHHFNFNGYWYPDATRFIGYFPATNDKTIHEFPLYSFVVSDLHGHVSDIPFVLLFMALLFSFLISKKPLRHYLLLTPLLAIMSVTNFWDLPIYLLLLGLVTLYLNYQKFGFKFKTFLQAGLLSTFYFLLSTLFALPFYLHFTQIAQGIAAAGHHSYLWQLFVLWGFPITVGISFIILQILSLCHSRSNRESRTLARNLDPRVKPEDDNVRGDDAERNEIFVLILWVLGIILVIIPEFVFIKDIYLNGYARSNTMFKLTYQAFMLFSISSGYIIVRLLTYQGNPEFSALNSGFRRFFRRLILFIRRKALLTFYFLLSLSVLIYPYFAINGYYNLKNYQGLYGLNFLQNSYPDDYRAILWLKQTLKGQPVVLEAAGDSYTDYGRVSMVTGFPTIEGWFVHEWLWRGTTVEPTKRSDEVKTIYETKDLEQAQLLLKKYAVSYIFIGKLEREKYKVNEEKFEKIGRVIFQQNLTKIYQLN